LRQAVTSTGGIAHTFSAFAKAGERTVLRLLLPTTGNATGFTGGNFDLGAGTVTLLANATGSITAVGNGWYRCSVTVTTAAGATAPQARFVVGTTSYQGDGFSGIYIWGAQLEAGAFPTSYIATVASQVTRSADAASMTGANFSSWYRADEGTIYGESQWTTTSARNNSPLFRFDDGTNNNFLSLVFRNVSPSAPASISVRASGGSEIAPTTPAVATNDGLAHKFAGSYTALQLAFSADAQSAGTATPIAIPVVNTARIGASNTGVQSLYAIYIRKLAFYPKALTAAELAGLTQI
jgi:hypothetical protein